MFGTAPSPAYGSQAGVIVTQLPAPVRTRNVMYPSTTEVQDILTLQCVGAEHIQIKNFLSRFRQCSSVCYALSSC